MNKLLPLALILLSFNAFSHGGDDGPSSLEDEFSKLGHVHLPVSYSTIHGLTFGYHDLGHGDDHHNDSTTEHEESHGDEMGLELDIHPVFFAGFDKIKRLISLDEKIGSDLRIEEADYSSPYLLLENKKWDFGVGVEGDAHLPLPLLAVGAGVSFVKGKNYYSLKNLTHKNEKRGPLLLPVDREALKSWRVGDQITYSSKGSIIFNVYVGIEPFFHIGPEYIHTGTHRIKAFLETDDLLEIEVTTTETDSVGIEGNAVVVGGESSLGKGHSYSVTYSFNIKEDSSFKAIANLFNGRIDLTNQEMLHSHGAIHLKTRMKNTSASYSGSFGIPIVYFNGAGGGKYSGRGTIEDHEEGEVHVSEVATVATVKERFTRGILSRHKWEYQSLVSTVMRGEHSLISSVFSWSFSRDKIGTKLFAKKMAKLKSIFHLPELGVLKLPSAGAGYLKADFHVNLSGEDLLFLLNTKELRKVNDLAINKLKDDFQTFGHRAFCRAKSSIKCLKGYSNLINNKHQLIRSEIVKLNAAYKKGNMSNIGEHLNRISKTLFSSKYLTWAYTNIHNGMSMELRLEGENIKKHVFSFKSVAP